MVRSNAIVARAIRYLLTALSVAAAIAAIAVWADLSGLFAPAEEPTTLQAKFAPALSPTETAEAALARLSVEPAVTGPFETHFQEAPFWLIAPLPHGREDRATLIQLESSHLRRVFVSAYDSAGQRLFKRAADRNQNAPDLASTSHGFALDMPDLRQQAAVLVFRVEAVGPAKIQLKAWDPIAFRSFHARSERSGGVLFGSIALLAVFSMVVALIARDLTFLYFTGYLLSSLGLAALAGGYENTWISTPLQALRSSTSRQVIAASYATFGFVLFSNLFRSELERLRLRPLASAGVVGGVILLALAFLLPYDSFLPLLWTFAVPACLFLLYALGRVVTNYPSTTAFLYVGSWGFALSGIVLEVAYASGALASKSAVLNNENGAIVSAMLIGIALAQKLRTERSARIAAQVHALSALKRFRDNYNSVPVGLVSTSLDGRILEFNPAFAQLIGLTNSGSRDERLHWDALFGNGSFRSVAAGLRDGAHTEAELSIGTEKKRWFRIRAVRVDAKIDASIEDTTERRAAEYQLRFLAHHDPLTSLLNRRGFDVRFEQASRAVADGQPVLLAYLDLDRFKLVNDLFGHTAGDHVLRQVAERLKGHVKTPHSVARVGGDEFLVLFHGIPVPDARKICESILGDIRSTPFTFQDKAFSVDGSIGLTPLERDMSERDAVATCDRACAEAKRLGGGTVVVLNENSAEVRQHLDEIRLIAGIRDSVPEGRLFTVMQPIVALRNAAGSLSYEVLLRMRDDDGKVIPPGRFIGAAERNGLMTRIDRWVLADTLRWLDAHPEHRERLDFASLNISGASLNDERFIEDVLSIVREHPESARRLCFEVTESVALYDINSTRRFVEMIKSFGARVALDDFGAGYTSFSYLKELRGDFVKVDGGFIRDVNSNPANFAITRAIVDVSHELGMACIAEWAENAEIVRSLLRLDVDFAQGYGLSRPLDSDVLLRAPDCGALMHDPEIRDLLDLGSPADAAAAQPRQFVLVG